MQTSPAFANGLVYTGGAYNNNVYALDAVTGAKIWNYTTGGGIFSAPAIVGNVLYVSCLDNKTYALNAQTGGFLWSYQTGGNLYSSPAVVNGVAYFGSYDGNVYAVGKLAGSSGVPTIIYYVVAIAVLIVIISIAVIVLRKRH